MLFADACCLPGTGLPGPAVLLFPVLMAAILAGVQRRGTRRGGHPPSPATLPQEGQDFPAAEISAVAGTSPAAAAPQAEAKPLPPAPEGPSP